MTTREHIEICRKDLENSHDVSFLKAMRHFLDLIESVVDKLERLENSK